MAVGGGKADGVKVVSADLEQREIGRPCDPLVIPSLFLPGREVVRFPGASLQMPSDAAILFLPVSICSDHRTGSGQTLRYPHPVKESKSFLDETIVNSGGKKNKEESGE